MNRFILGLGAQKSGTTWLWQLLQTGDFAKPGRKEFHFLNKIPAETSTKYNELNSQQTQTAIAGITLTNPANKEGWVADYVAHFSALVRESGKSITGELTPAYALLPSEILSTTRKQLISSGFEPKVLFVMRDPVDRVISAFKMDIGKYPEKYIGITDLNNKLMEFTHRIDVTARTQYEKTLRNLNSVFSANETYVGIYEEMFTSDNIKNLADFLEMKLDNNFYTRKVFPSTIDLNISQKSLNLIRKYFSETYETVGSLYPQTHQLWHSRINS